MKALAVLLGTFFLAIATSHGATKPNIIVILGDDLGAKELSCYGSKRHQTPNLDRMAAEGIRFETFYATPLCTPTRLALMTGQHGFHNGFLGMSKQTFIPAPGSPQSDIGRHFTFADLLKSRGYATALAGKWQLSGTLPTLIHDAGFDEYRMWAYQHNLPPEVTHPGRENGNGKPSRYWHPGILENGRYVPTQPGDFGPDLFNDFVIDFARRHGGTPRDGQPASDSAAGAAALERAKPFFIYYTSVLTHVPRVDTPDPANPGVRRPAGLKSNLEYLDHLIGKLFTALRGAGLDENTLVFFIGDNGTGGDGKATVTELGVRVPCLVRGPGVKPGVVTRALANLTDILPTLAEVSGAELPKDRPFDGRSLCALLRGDTEMHREWNYSYLDDGRLLRGPRWLLQIAPGGAGEMFFDCGASRDGTGYTNVTDSSDPDVKAARQRFAAILASMPEPKPHAKPPR